MSEVGAEISPAEIYEYWRHSREFGQGWATSSPASSRHVPIGLHGDCARMASQNTFQKVFALSINLVLFRPASIRHSRFVIFTCPRHKIVKNRTLNVLFNRVLWSLEAAFDGINPVSPMPGRSSLLKHDADRAGVPLTPFHTKFALTEIRGDWEFHRDVWRTTASWNGKLTCFRCPSVAKGPAPLLYWNYGDSSEWKDQEFGTEQFIARRLRGRNLCTLARPCFLMTRITYAKVASVTFSLGLILSWAFK